MKIDRVTAVKMLLLLMLVAFSCPAMAARMASAEGLQTISDVRLQDVFLAYVCERLEKNPEDVVLSRFRPSGNRPVAKGKIDLRVLETNRRSFQGNVRCEILVSVNGIVQNRITATGWVDVFEPVVFAAKDLKRGDILTKDDVYLERMNLARASSRVVSDLDAVIGLECKRSIRMETALKQWMLERPATVSKGDVVTIVAQSFGLRVTVPGRVMDTGYAGETVEVENIMSKKRIYATVRDSSTVTVDF